MAPNLRKRQNSPNFYRSETKKHKKESSSSSSESEDEIEEESDLSDNEYIYEEIQKLKKNDPIAFANLQAVKEEILRTEPDAKKMLLTPMNIEDRAKLCQYYEIYKTQVPNTTEWLECRIKYNLMFKEYKIAYEQSKKYSDHELLRMKEEEEKFTGFDAHLSLKYKILNLETSKENKEVIYKRYEEFLSLNSNSDDEFSKLKHWLTWATDFPHDRLKNSEKENITEFIKNAKIRLDKELYGMEKVKEQILLFLSAKLRNPSMVHANLGLVGPPGTGKTCIARLIAEIMDCGFSQISFGGVDRADFLKGHEYTYVGAQPGEIVKCIKRMGHKNGIIFLDELDKISDNPEIRSALLHMLDPSQNTDYHDNFLGGEIKIDLSKIWYIGSMNSPPLDEALADRWWIINVEGYERVDKVNIIENYLLPKALLNCGLSSNAVSLQNGAALYLINKVCRIGDKGVRTIEKTIKDLVNKISFISIHQNTDGLLPFKTSFQLKEKLSFPFILNSTILDILIDNKELDISLSMMYI